MPIVRLPLCVSGLYWFIKMLSISVELFELILVGREIVGIKQLDDMMSRKFEVSLWPSILMRSKLKSPAIQIFFLDSLEIFLISGVRKFLLKFEGSIVGCL